MVSLYTEALIENPTSGKSTVNINKNDIIKNLWKVFLIPTINPVIH